MLRFMRWFVQWAPVWLISPLIWVITLYYRVHPNRSTIDASRRFLARALGRPVRWSDTLRHFRTFAHVVLERVLLLSGGTRKFDTTVRGDDIIRAHHESQRGGVLLGGHLGSFEMLRAYDRELPGLQVRYMMFPDNAEATTALLNELNPDVARQVISLSNGQAAMLAACEYLDDGQFVAFLGDRMPRMDARHKVEVTFFGAPVWLPTSPYIAAMVARVPLILCFAPRTGTRRYDITFEEIYDGSPVARTERHAKSEELAQIFANRMETLCRQHPYNWFNFFDIWH